MPPAGGWEKKGWYLMKHMSKPLMGGLLAASLAAGLALPAGAALVQKTFTVNTDIDLYVADQSITPVDSKGNPTGVFVSEGTTYLPVRAMGEALGVNVAWDGSTSSVHLSENTADSKDGEYLQTYFGISPLTGTLSRESFNAALEKIGGTKTNGSGTFTLAEAVAGAVSAAGLEELALTYTAEPDTGKAAERLAAYGVTGVSDAYAGYVAAALDSSLASSTWDFGGAVNGDTATTILMNAVEISGQGRNYLGNASDSDIYQKLQSAWASFGLFDDATLSDLGAELVIAGASTGYNLKYDGYDARFLPSYTLQYGHSDITHAVQLIALLNSEGLDAKVQLEPKTSIYEYLVEWGDPTQIESTPTYELKPIDGGRWLCYATEYDMKLEFDTVADKEAFDAIVGQYAKKWDSNTDENGNPTVPLLEGAWWQPLYTSTVPMSDKENFVHIVDNVVRNGAYTIHPFSTVDGGDAIAKVVKEKAPSLKVEPVDLYVNLAFYNYLTGADHQ